MTETENKTITMEIKTKKDLKKFMLEIKDKLADQSSAIYALTALNQIMALPKIYDFLDSDLKELGRDIWLRLEKTGFHLERPALFFAN